MGYTFDNFVAHLQCPKCAAISADDHMTLMKTGMRAKPSMAFLRVGDELFVDPAIMEQSGYLKVRDLADDRAVHILQTWSCPTCGTGMLWSEIVVEAGKISSIVAVRLDANALARAHYIECEAKEIAAELAGKDYTAVADADVIEILRHAL